MGESRRHLRGTRRSSDQSKHSERVRQTAAGMGRYHTLLITTTLILMHAHWDDRPWPCPTPRRDVVRLSTLARNLGTSSGRSPTIINDARLGVMPTVRTTSYVELRLLSQLAAYGGRCAGTGPTAHCDGSSSLTFFSLFLVLVFCFWFWVPSEGVAVRLRSLTEPCCALRTPLKLLLFHAIRL